MYAMRWRSDARFSWCDESTRLSVHTACDRTVFFSHYQICMCVFKLETRPMRAIIAAIVASRAATRQCKYIIEIYRVLIFPLVALLHRSTHRSLCKRSLTSNLASIDTPKTLQKYQLTTVQLRHVMRKPVFAICEQQRRRSACASAQSDQHLCCSLLR